MENLAPILQALAALGWVVFAFTVLIVFRIELQGAFARLKKGKLLGQEFESEQDLRRLNTSADAAARETEQLPPEEKIKPTPEREDELDSSVQNVLQQATADPKLALMMLSAEIERRARQALAARGVLSSRGAVALSEGLHELHRYGFPEQLIGSLKSFAAVRNKIVHGANASRDDILQAIDSGIKILRALNVLQSERNVVWHPGVTLFSNDSATVSIPDAKGVILETTSSKGRKRFRIFPTTKTHFQKGKVVAWEWNTTRVWGPAWFRDPETNEIKKAWDSAGDLGIVPGAPNCRENPIVVNARSFH